MRIGKSLKGPSEQNLGKERSFKMQATRVIKTIEHTELQELLSYLGQKVEIIILPLTEEIVETSEDDLETQRQQFFEIIEHCAGHVTPWKREELYDR
jgi:hypothetical protein